MPRANSGLWTPGGVVPFNNRDQQEASPREMNAMANFHEVANKFSFTVVCRFCDHPMIGQNNDNKSDGDFVVACKCREIRCSRTAVAGATRR